MDPTSISPDTVNVGIFVVCAAFLTNAVAAIATVVWVGIKIFRRNPSVDETLKDYVQRDEFQRHLEDVRETFHRHDEEIKGQRSYTAKSTQAIFNELRRMTDGMNKELQDINKAIGRIEGELKKKD